MIWWVFYALAIVALIMAFKGPNAVWGTATVGFIVGIIVAFLRPGFNWWTVAKITTIAVLVGAIFELVPRILRGKPKGP